MDPLAHKYPSLSPFSGFADNPILLKDEDGREPVKSQAGTSRGFVGFLNNTTSRMGTLRGERAKDAMMRLSKIEMDGIKPVPATTGPFNTSKDRYVYTEKGGWIDMSHFMFYAGRAYKHKQEGENLPMREAIQEGFQQEYLDQQGFAVHSAYSYEDLPSDKFGAEFGAYFFDPQSDLNLGQQVELYLNSKLKATDPQRAPNYSKLPAKDSKNPPTKKNHTTNPLHTLPLSGSDKAKDKEKKDED